MSSIALTKTETRLLTEAAGREHGLVILPPTMKAVTTQLVLGKLTKHGVVVAREHDGSTDHHLTPAGYRAIGLKPPRRPRTPVADSNSAEALKPGTKRSLILDLLGREEGASLDELVAATGWLPHTTRAALSRLRSGGQVLLKSARPDGRTAYRIASDEPETVRARAARRSPEPVEAVA